MRRLGRGGLALSLLLLSLWPGTGCGSSEPAGEAKREAAEASRPPNIVLIISDDHGYPDYGFMGSPTVRTPTIDRLAREGVAFTNGYSTASLCRPALKTLLTGFPPRQLRVWERRWRRIRMRHGSNPGADRRREPSFAARLETLPRLLSRAGYVTYQAGKYWEGRVREAGFDDGMGPEAPDDRGRIRGPWHDFVRKHQDPVFEFLEKNKDRPFFLWYAPMLPHYPHDPQPRYLEMYADVEEPARSYYASITRLDDGIADLVGRVHTLGLEERTLFVYLADNGWDPEVAEGWNPALGGPKGKLSLHELGLRTPIVLRWKGGIEPRPMRRELVSFTDVYVTILDYAGAERPPQRPGYSLRPLIEEGAEWPRRDVAGWQYPVRGETSDINDKRTGVFWRDARWHYLEHSDGTKLLFDLEADPLETHDVSSEHPELVQRARARIDAMYEEVDEQRDLPAEFVVAPAVPGGRVD